MRLEQILLVVRDQAHSLSRSVALCLTARRPGPRLYERSRISLRSHSTSGEIKRRKISSVLLGNGDTVKLYPLVPGLFDFRLSPA